MDNHDEFINEKARSKFEKLGYEVHFDNHQYLTYISFNRDTHKNYKSIQFNKESETVELCVSKNHTFAVSRDLNDAVQQQIKELREEKENKI